MKVHIRKAISADAKSIVGFQLKMAKETEDLLLDQTTVEQGVSAVFHDKNKGSYFVAEVNNEVVGSLMTTYEWSDWRNGNVLWIQSVYVQPEMRGKGIYRKLYEHVKSLVQDSESEYRGIRLYVDKTNSNAQTVYERLGMVKHHYHMYEWMQDY